MPWGCSGHHTSDDTDKVHWEAELDTHMPSGDDTDKVHTQHVARDTHMPSGNNTDKVHREAEVDTHMPSGDDTHTVHTQHVARDTNMSSGDDTDQVHTEPVPDDTGLHTGDQTLDWVRSVHNRADWTPVHTGHPAGQDRSDSHTSAYQQRCAGSLELADVEWRPSLHGF